MSDLDAQSCRARARALARKADSAADYAIVLAYDGLAREWLRLAALLESEEENCAHIDTHVGERLRAFRSEAGLDPAELGARSGVGVREIELYESGAVAVPAAVVWRLAQGLDRPVTAFYPAPRTA